MTRQKTYLVTASTSGNVQGLDEVNLSLSRGWRFVSATPLGGAASGEDQLFCVGALVVLEREDRSESMIAAAAEEREEVVEELLEGDGANADLGLEADT